MAVDRDAARGDSFDAGPGGQITHMHEPDAAHEHDSLMVHAFSGDPWGPCAFCQHEASHPIHRVPAASAANGLVCTCSATLRPNERMVVSSAHCPTHGVAAFLRGLQDDPDEGDGFVVEDGSDV